MEKEFILEYSHQQDLAGMYPYHIRTKSSRPARGNIEWETVFEGTSNECHAKSLINYARKPTRYYLFDCFYKSVCDFVFSLPCVIDPDNLPASPGIYFVSEYDGDSGEIIYIGMTNAGLRSRWSNHQLRKYVNEGNFTIYYLEGIPRKSISLKIEEALFILIMNPRLNRRIGSINLK